MSPRTSRISRSSWPTAGDRSGATRRSTCSAVIEISTWTSRASRRSACSSGSLDSKKSRPKSSSGRTGRRRVCRGSARRSKDFGPSRCPGGRLANPSYEAVCTDTTGHAEAVQITFDPSVIPLADILRIFFSVHDPTTLNRQGGDVGTQYRSAIFYNAPEQEKTARQVMAEIFKAGIWGRPIVTEVAPLQPFYRAAADMFTVFSQFEAFVCQNCGYTEFYRTVR